MDIAAMSTMMSQANVRMEASIAIMEQIKNVAEMQGEQLIEMMQQSNTQTVPHPTLGQTIDISV